ncbi:OsmC family protein [Dehalococcoidia bacterium]|nr:OsmC family protein [Dehalococcoidia bacterium]
MTIRDMQWPIKELYKNDPTKAAVTLTARATMLESGPYACSIKTGQEIVETQARAGVGGPGTAACSGDLLLGALAACTQITVQMVAASMGLTLRDIQVEVQGDLDLRGTLGLSRKVPVGFQPIRTSIDVQGDVESAQLQSLQERTDVTVWS